MKKILLALSASGLIFSGCFDEAAKTPASTLDREYMTTATYANLAAEDLGNMAVSNGNSNSQWMGNIMIQDHKAAQAELALLAQRENLTLPTTPDSVYMGMRTVLIATPTGNFNRAISLAQIKSQQNAIAIFRNEINNGSSPAIRPMLPNICRYWSGIIKLQTASHAYNNDMAAQFQHKLHNTIIPVADRDY